MVPVRTRSLRNTMPVEVYQSTLRLLAMRWRLRARQVAEGKAWARGERDNALASAKWNRAKINELLGGAK